MEMELEIDGTGTAQFRLVNVQQAYYNGQTLKLERKGNNDAYIQAKLFMFTVKENLHGRTKKDGVGTFSDLGNDYNKRNKLHYEFMCRDFCHAILKHAGEYGTHITEKQWIIVESGKNAAALFGWGACFGRSEKSHMAGLRGFEMEKDLGKFGKLNS